MTNRMTLEVDRMTMENHQAYRDIAREDTDVSVSQGAAVQPVGADGAWVTVHYWISAARMRNYLRRQPHQREGGT